MSRNDRIVISAVAAVAVLAVLLVAWNRFANDDHDDSARPVVTQSSVAPAETTTSTVPMTTRLQRCLTVLRATATDLGVFLTDYESGRLDGPGVSVARGSLATMRSACVDELPECGSAFTNQVDKLEEMVTSVAGAAAGQRVPIPDLTGLSDLSCDGVALPKVTTTTAPPTVEDRARAILAEVWPSEHSPEDARRRFVSAMDLMIADSEMSPLMAGPTDELFKIYADRLFRWQRVDPGALGEPWAGIFAELRRSDELQIDALKGFQACAVRCDLLPLMQSWTEATRASTVALAKLTAVLPPA